MTSSERVSFLFPPIGELVTICDHGQDEGRALECDKVKVMDDPIYRAGAWWAQRNDGRWLYWNILAGRWDDHPYGPPGTVAKAAERVAARQSPDAPAGPPPPPPYAPLPQVHPQPPAPYPPSCPPAPPPYPVAQPGTYHSGYPPPYPPPYGQFFMPPPKPAPSWAAGSPVVYAEWWQRMLAFLVDLVVVWGPTLVVMLIASQIAGPGEVDPLSGDVDSSTRNAVLVVTFIVCYLVFISAYFALSHGGEAGATLGKRLLRIRVADLGDGSSVGAGRAFLRWVVAGSFWTFLYIPGLLNLLWPIWDPQRQSWHDKIVNSVVVTEPR